MPVEERLFSLVLALLATDAGLTKNEILATVQGYRQRYSASGDNANLERQFERDKDDIRELGVPLEMSEPPGQPGNNQNLRYRIPRGSYELPRDISFSAEETGLLNLAAMVWREGSISTESRRALLKLRSIADASDDPVLGYAPSLRVRDAAFEPLRTALEKRVIVRFSYLKPGEPEAHRRTVEPLALVQYQGRWHLSAEDTATGQRRTFLLRRIVSPVQLTTTHVAPRATDETSRALDELEQLWSSRVAVVEVESESDAATRLLKRRDTLAEAGGALRLHFSDEAILADELAGYGPEVRVIGPAELRDAVRDRLATTLAAHSDPSGERRPSAVEQTDTRRGYKHPRQPAPQAADKLAFLLALVPWLVDHDRVSVADAAAHFGVDHDQIRDAVKLIAVSGIPGETTQYQHGDLFDIAWDRFEDDDEIVLTHLVAIDDSPRFSGREAAALIAGLQYLSALPENADRGAIDSLMTKLARGASAQPSAVAVEATASDAALATIRRAVTAGRQLEFDYASPGGEREHRRVDPLRVESIDTDWYLRGWCHLRGAVRTFRLDRIEHLVSTEQPITHRADDLHLPDTLFERSPDDIVVTIDIAPAAVPLIEDYIPDDAAREQVDGRERTTIRVPHFHGLKRLVAGLPGVVSVVDPPEARRAVAEWAAAGVACYPG